MIGFPLPTQLAACSLCLREDGEETEGGKIQSEADESGTYVPGIRTLDYTIDKIYYFIYRRRLLASSAPFFLPRFCPQSPRWRIPNRFLISCACLFGKFHQTFFDLYKEQPTYCESSKCPIRFLLSVLPCFGIHA